MTYYVDPNMYPFTTVAFVEARFGSNWVTGSGVLVGRNDVLTASHVIYDVNYGLADEVIVYFSYDPTGSSLSYQVAEIEYFEDFDPDGDSLLYTGDMKAGTLGHSELDIALLSLHEAAGDVQGWMGMEFGFDYGYAYVTGHPGAYDNYMVEDYGWVVRDDVDHFLWIDDLQVSPGNSGGPIWINNGWGPYVVGVVSTTIAATSISGHEWLVDAAADNDFLLDDAFLWSLSVGNIQVVAATYQFFTGGIPTPQGFQYLISSSDNPNDLNDSYYAQFNQENRFINFASNLGTAGEGALFFKASYGALSFEETVFEVYDEVVGIDWAYANGLNATESLNFLLGARGFYESVAAERVVREGVSLAEATKIVAIGSILYEAVKAEAGLYGEAIDTLADDLGIMGNSPVLGQDLFSWA